MKITRIQKGLVLVTIAAGALAGGCELIVDFDRTKIPVETTDAATLDVNVPDTAPVGEAGTDAAVTADADAGEIADSGGDGNADQ